MPHIDAGKLQSPFKRKRVQLFSALPHDYTIAYTLYMEHRLKISTLSQDVGE